MIKKVVVILVALSTVLLLGAVTSPASASGSLQFKKIYYDSPGSDTGSNASLNAEYVTVKNTGTSTRSLSGYTIRDETGFKYRFPTGAKLRPGYSVKVHTGSGSNTSSNRYWSQSRYVWNNTGDTATLRNSSGVKRDTCSWSSGGPGYKYC
ncbi:lamin tail domain-containing protein [Aeromicrobium sp.]|uniref:lamin tail domain-containing protein n=1 Tax=Aeromicrobium sp. TaxID=1871063 RepID=UPI0019A84897|nr:lamin tail domain-containing protein [Aeromicrobium sp.]MBC7632429.1 lamin tail domain-containing protein [Aeromicrobium sp.]